MTITREMELDARLCALIMEDLADDMLTEEMPLRELMERELTSWVQDRRRGRADGVPVIMGRMTEGAEGTLPVGPAYLPNFVTSLETCRPDVNVCDWEYVADYMREGGIPYSDAEIIASIERVLALANAALENNKGSPG